MPSILTRRSFIKGSFLSAAGLAFGAMMNVPPFLQRALAEGTIGLNGKKLLFIFLRGANDALNTVIPVGDSSYHDPSVRSSLAIPKDPATDYSASTGLCDVQPASYQYAVNLRNGFAALHPALVNLAPVYNDGDLALVQRVGYPRQSRSHFDSQRYWESGLPSSRAFREGIFYRVLAESGLSSDQILTGVSVQKNLPLLLRGPLPMTNLSDPARYNVIGVYPGAREKHLNAIGQAYDTPYPDKENRELVVSLGQRFRQSVDLFQQIQFASNAFYDSDGSTHLFPIDAASNGRGLGGGEVTYDFFKKLKTAAMVLANTNAIIAGTEMGGFDTHVAQGGATGAHANLIARIGWGIYALRKYFSDPANNNGGGSGKGKNMWDDIVVITLSEFGRTTVQNGSNGTDHAEAGMMFVAGGAVKGGTYECGPNSKIPWIPGPPNQGAGVDGSMFAVSGRYLKRTVDYRSVLGEIIRNHLGATQNQLNRIIPGYAQEDLEHLRLGGVVTKASKLDNVDTPIVGELGLFS